MSETPVQNQVKPKTVKINEVDVFKVYDALRGIIKDFRSDYEFSIRPAKDSYTFVEVKVRHLELGGMSLALLEGIVKTLKENGIQTIWVQSEGESVVLTVMRTEHEVE